MKKIGIIGAMELEVETLKEHMSAANITKKANMEFYEGTLNGAAVVIVRSGVGKVNATLFGYQPGEVPQLGCREFVADARLAELAVAACEEVNPDIHASTGRVLSGDQFISSKAVKEHLIQEFHGDCTEMEGASIAQGAFLNEIPFVIIRAISDKADDSAQIDYPVFEKAAALHSARLVEHMLPRI